MNSTHSIINLPGSILTRGGLIRDHSLFPGVLKYDLSGYETLKSLPANAKHKFSLAITSLKQVER